MVEKTKKNHFCSLMPDDIEVSEIYNEAFEYMMDKKIKNIAITGTYGAGKSSVLNSFISNNKDKKGDKGIENKDIITISLGNYDDNNKNNDNNNENYIENKIENHIISQILSQINGKKIPLLKDKIPVGKTSLTIIWNIILILSFVCGFILLNFNINIPFIKSVLTTKLIELGLFIAPIIISIYKFQKNNSEIKISGIKLKGIQTDVKTSFDEVTAFDKDLKEIIYLLGNSHKKFVIFEDLDRFEDVTIFSKLKEINFLVNKYMETNIKKSDGIKFIYLLNDSLLDSKIRTKFFDFIIPIVPITTSSNSETQLLQYVKNNINKNRQPTESFLCDISLYIDDMRLLRNIINEYIIYSNIISMDQLDLQNDKLFALITIKNIFPEEYYSLQSNKGYIYSLLQDIKNKKREKRENLEAQKNDIKIKIKEIKQSLIYSELELMTLLLPNNIWIEGNQEKWIIFLKQWKQNPQENYLLHQENISESYNYHRFVEKYINPQKDEEYKRRCDFLEKNTDHNILNLNKQIKKIDHQILQINKGNNYTFFSLLTDEEREDFFKGKDYSSKDDEKNNTPIYNKDYFPIIEYFIINSIIDDSYMYYISNYSTDSLLKTNDIIYRKCVLEGREADLFLDVESPKELVRRFNEKDFSQPYIINYNIFIHCLSEENSYVLMMTNSLIQNDSLNKLINIINKLTTDQLNRYVTLLILNQYTISLKEIVNYPDLKRRNILLQNIYSDNNTSQQLLEDLKEYIIDDPGIIFNSNDNFERAVDNICKIDIKIPIVRQYKLLNSERIDILLDKRLYSLDVKTINNILIMYLPHKNIEYKELLNHIYNDSRLEKMKSYVQDNMDEFLENYITNSNEEFNNNEEIIFDVLDSNIELSLKEQYLEKNIYIVNNIQKIVDMDEFENYSYYLFENNTLKCTSQNIKFYWNSIQEYDLPFLNFLNKNIEQKNYQDILEDNTDICNQLINDKDISGELRLFMMEYADSSIKKIDEKLEHQQVYSLITKDFIEVNDDNINILIEKGYYDILNEIYSRHENTLEVLLRYKDLSENTVKEFINEGLNENLVIEILKNTSLILSIKDIPITYKKTIECMFELHFNTMTSKDFEYILLHLEDFNEAFTNTFYKKLNQKILISILEDKYDKEQLILPILTNNHMSTDNKIFIIEQSIVNRCDIDTIRTYISTISDIKNLATVWDGKYPNYDDNKYQQIIADTLEKYGYIKKRKDNKLQKIK